MGAIEKVGLLAGFSLFSVLLHAREGRADGSTIFPMEEAGGRPAGPEQPWGAGWPPGEGGAADGTSSPWRRPAATRPARSSPGELVAAREGESSMVPSSPWERPAAARPARSSPGELGGHQESEDRQEILISPTLIMAPNIDKGHKVRG